MVLGALMGPPVALVMNRLTQRAVDREVWLALKRHGRSGLPVMPGAVYFSPLAGAIALFGVLTFF
jgi:hypothetical protein